MPDPRAALTPSQVVDGRLLALLGGGHPGLYMQAAGRRPIGRGVSRPVPLSTLTEGRPMSDATPPPGKQALRGIDTNSLLRLYDGAVRTAATTRIQLDRENAEKTPQRIAAELRKRGAPV